MLDNFGARLRQRREQQGIDLIAIAAQTKIKLSLLEALERDDVSHWPSGIYRRAYIRAYAQAIGLNPDSVVREFLEVHPDPAEIAAAAAIAAAAEAARTNSGPPTRLRNLMGSALGSLTRLRRASGSEDQAAPQAMRIELPPSAELDFPTVTFDEPPEPVQASNWPVIENAADHGPVPPQDPPAALEPSPQLQPPGRTDPVTSFEVDFVTVAHLCTELGRIGNADDLQPMLEQAARILDATGLIVWIWDGSAEGLRPVLAHGYSDKVLAHLPTVSRDADNATAAAFRTAQPCAIAETDHASGALVVPLLTPAGPAGVLTIELQLRRDHSASLQAAATILASLLAQLVGAQAAADEPQIEIGDTPTEHYGPPVLQNTMRR